jgi:hypothetical protein
MFSPLCCFDRGQRTVKHVLIFCPWHVNALHELRDEQGHLHGYLKFVGTAGGLGKAIKWLVHRGILGQFRGAREALHSPLIS